MTLNFPKQALFFIQCVLCNCLNKDYLFFFFICHLAGTFILSSLWTWECIRVFFWSGGRQASISDAVNTVFYMLTYSGEYTHNPVSTLQYTAHEGKKSRDQTIRVVNRVQNWEVIVVENRSEIFWSILYYSRALHYNENNVMSTMLETTRRSDGGQGKNVHSTYETFIPHGLSGVTERSFFFP